MPASTFGYSFGIEEEFFLVDPDTRDVVADVPLSFVHGCKSRLGECVQDEMLRAQVEIATPILSSAAQARQVLNDLRGELSRVAASCDFRLLAAGTHPLAAWQDQLHTERPRYERLIDDFQIVGRRNLLCGLHVHVAVPEAVDRVALMNRLMPWLPLILALSTSSPFWDSRRTGLLSYRQAAYDEWPRSGIPDAFQDESEYASFVELLTRCGSLNDGSFLWWAIRPSSRYPTLELRISDACTRIGDALALAAAFRCLVRAHVRCPELGQARSALTRRVIEENRWRAKRYGTSAQFIDESRPGPVNFGETLQQFQELLAPDAEALRCESDLQHLNWIAQHGSSAHAQLSIYRRQRELGLERRPALLPVIDWLLAATIDSSTRPLRQCPPALKSERCRHVERIAGVGHVLDPLG